MDTKQHQPRGALSARTILLIENNAADAKRVRDALTPFTECVLVCDTRLERGLERMAAGDIDVVLLDPSLPETSGLDALARVREQTQEIPVVLLTGESDDIAEEQALSAGAQECLPKSEISSLTLRRAIRYAMERQHMQRELLKLCIIDGMTGLYNRRGFTTVASQYLKSAERSGGHFFAAFVDIDGLKQINDTLGREMGDVAIRETAEILKHTFRASDVLARLDADRFVVLVTDVNGDAEPIIQRRIELWQKQANARPHRPYQISLSIGIARGDEDEDDGSLEALIARANHAAYEQKLAKRACTIVRD